METRRRVGVSSKIRPGKIDAIFPISNDLNSKLFALEWETGNISSSHRALNKILLGIFHGRLVGGVLVLPTRKLYNYLTDRVGNFQELAPYFPIYNIRSDQIDEGVLYIISVEHDFTDETVPLIFKGTDGWAQFTNPKKKS